MPSFDPARLADLVLLTMAGEAVLFLLAGRGWRATAGALLPGAALVLAVRAALAGAGLVWVMLALTLAFPAHLLDLAQRGWLGRRGRRGASAASGASPRT